MPLGLGVPDAEIDRQNFHNQLSPLAPRVTELLLKALPDDALAALYDHHVNHDQDIIGRCSWAEQWLPRSRQHGTAANELMFIVGALLADTGSTPTSRKPWHGLLAGSVDWSAVDIETLLTDCPHLVPPTAAGIASGRPGMSHLPEGPWRDGLAPRSRMWSWFFHPSIEAERACDNATGSSSLSACRHMLSWEFFSSPESILLAPLMAMPAEHPQANAVRQAIRIASYTRGGADLPDNAKVCASCERAGIWQPTQAEPERPREPQRQPGLSLAFPVVQSSERVSPDWPRWLATTDWWSDPDILQSAANTDPHELFASLASAVPHLPPHAMASLATHFNDVVRRLQHWEDIRGMAHPAWRNAFTSPTVEPMPVIGMGTFWRLHGSTACLDIVRPFLAALVRRTDEDTIPALVEFQRTWLLMAIDWTCGTAIPADGRHPKTEGLLARLPEPGSPPAVSGWRIVAAARRAWHDLEVSARQDQPAPASPHDARIAMELIIRTKGFTAGFKAVLLLLRALRQPAVGPSLATYASAPMGTYVLAQQETRDLSWSWVAEDGVGIIQALRSRDRTGAIDLLQEIGELLVERLKPVPAKASDRPRAVSEPTVGGWHPVMLEPSAIWRRGYVRAIGELAMREPQRICRVLEHVRQTDPDQDVRATAVEALAQLSERSRRLGHDAPARLLMHAWWRLRWAHRLALGLPVDQTAAFGTRMIEVRTPRHIPTPPTPDAAGGHYRHQTTPVPGDVQRRTDAAAPTVGKEMHHEDPPERTGSR